MKILLLLFQGADKKHFFERKLWIWDEKQVVSCLTNLVQICDFQEGSVFMSLLLINPLVISLLGVCSVSSFSGQWFSKRFRQPLGHQLVLFALAKPHSPISCSWGFQVPLGVGAWAGFVWKIPQRWWKWGFFPWIPPLGWGCHSFPVDVLVLGKGSQEVSPLDVLTLIRLYSGICFLGVLGFVFEVLVEW